MRGILLGLILFMIAQPAWAAPKCSQIIGKSVHFTGTVVGAVKTNDGAAGYLVSTAGAGQFPYCISVMTAIIDKRGKLLCQEHQRITGDGVIIGVIQDMGDAQVQSTKYSCQGAGTAPPDLTSLIFFDWGSSDLSSAAKSTATQVKSRLKASSHVTIAGHCDTSEQSPDALSLSRAAAVKQVLVAAGVPEASIAVIGKSTDEKLVPTGANAREPQNRYVSFAIE
jgi:outer membrane protein OmpA-like peptidoglycan-associated protein